MINGKTLLLLTLAYTISTSASEIKGLPPLIATFPPMTCDRGSDAKCMTNMANMTNADDVCCAEIIYTKGSTSNTTLQCWSREFINTQSSVELKDGAKISYKCTTTSATKRYMQNCEYGRRF